MKKQGTRPTGKRVTQELIAQLAGTTRSAVAHALNPRLKSRISPELCSRIEKVTSELGYRPSRLAQILRGGRSGMVGIVTPFGLLQANAARVYHLSSVLHERGWRVSVETVSSAKETEAALLGLQDAHAEGIFILASLSGHMNRVQLASLSASGIPCVRFTGGPIPGYPVIRANIRDGMRMLVEHLIALGHRHLAFVGASIPPNPDPGIHWPSVERFSGISDAITAHGGKCIPGECHVAPGLEGLTGEILHYDGPIRWDDPPLPGRTSMESLLKRKQLPDVLLLSNDDWALGALGAAMAKGISIPSQIAVTGFDATVAGEFSVPPLTSVELPILEQATCAVDQFEQMLRREKLQPDDDFRLLPCKLVIRQSCGAKISTSPVFVELIDGQEVP